MITSPLLITGSCSLLSVPVLVSPALVNALGWTIIHTLWQGAAIALVLAVLLPAMNRYPAQVRYRAAVVAQLLLLGSAMATFGLLFDWSESATTSESRISMYPSVASVEPAVFAEEPRWSLLEQGRAYINQHIQVISMIWLVGVLLFSLRLLGAWSYTRYMRGSQVNRVTAAWEARFQVLVRAMAIRPVVVLLESAMARTPMVIGHIKPVVLLPVGMITQLPPAQVEALIVHELAHIHRRDYLVNLLLSVHETLFFFHPATWWIRTVVHREREYCCDEIAVQFCGSSLEYAKALSALPVLYPESQPLLAMAATGRPKELLGRIKRILLEQPSNQHDLMEKMIATALIIGAVSLLSMRADATVAPVSDSTTPWQAVIPADTIPAGKITIREEKNGQSMEAKLEDGKIVSIQMDGQPVADSDFHLYEDRINELLEKLPPAPPRPPRPMTPPPPPAPGSNRFFYFRGDTDTPDEQRHIIINGDSLFIDGRFRFDSADNFFEGAANPEEMARRMEEMAKHMEEEGNRIQLKLDEDEMEIEIEESIEKGMREGMRGLREGLRGLREGLNGINLNFEWEEKEEGAPSFGFEWEEKELDGDTPFPPGAEELGIFPGARNRRLTTQQQIERALLRDELIDKHATYKFELSDRTLKINGDKLPETLRKKYQRIYENASGLQWESKNRVIIHKMPGE